MKRGGIKLYIWVAIIIVIFWRIYQELQMMRSIPQTGQLTILYQITQIQPKCLYSTDYLYFVIPECHQVKVGETYRLAGSLSGLSDTEPFSKKRLIIQEKKLIASNICSLFAWKTCFLEWRNHIWQLVQQPVIENIPAPHGLVLLSMIYGSQAGMDTETRELFRVTGTSHIQAVSGYNFAIIASGVLTVTQRHLRKRAQGIVILACTLMFFYLVGMQPSVIRAVLTLITVLGIKFFLMRQYNSQFYLALVLVFMILVNPLWILSISFQLSAAAVAGILYIQPLLQHRFDVLCIRCIQKSKHNSRLPSFVIEFVSSLTTSLAAALATAPILLLNFHELPLLGICISTICSSLLNFIVTVGFWTTLTAAICYSWAIKSVCILWIKLVLYLPLEVFLSSMQAASQINFLTIRLESFPLWAVCMYYCAIVLWVKMGNTQSLKEERKVFV